jgi:hypothetical protein
MVSYERGLRNGLPPYVSMPQVSRSGGPNFLGGQHAPFVIDGNPDNKSFKVRDVTLPAEISEGRAANRLELRQSLDRMQRFSDKLTDDPAVTFDQFYAQGLQLVRSQPAQEAFDIQREDEKVRDADGVISASDCCLPGDWCRSGSVSSPSITVAGIITRKYSMPTGVIT